MVSGSDKSERNDLTQLAAISSFPVLGEKDRVQRSGYTPFDGFIVRQQDVNKLRDRIKYIESLRAIDKQFIATLLDTEAAIGYYRRKEFYRRKGFVVGRWRAYISVKMTYKGDIARLATLLGLKVPERTTMHYNTLKATRELAWSLHTSGLRPYVAIRTVAPFLYNEKTKIEAECIIKHGPILPGEQPHPFESEVAVRIKRGVWIWPNI